MSFVSLRISRVEGKQKSLFLEGPVIKILLYPHLKIKQTTHECNTLQFNEEPKIANTQLQKSTVLQEVKNVKSMKEMNESFFVTIRIYQ